MCTSSTTVTKQLFALTNEAKTTGRPERSPDDTEIFTSYQDVRTLTDPSAKPQNLINLHM